MSVDTILCILSSVLLVINSVMVYLLIKQNRETERLIEQAWDSDVREES